MVSREAVSFAPPQRGGSSTVHDMHKSPETPMFSLHPQRVTIITKYKLTQSKHDK